MKNRQKNKYFLFLCSLLPGAAEMCVGLMHMGTSLMAAFFGSIGLFAFFSEMEGLLFIPALLWFYGFFHARNLLSCDEEVFEATEDVYIWDEFFGENVFHVSRALPRKWGAAILILFGLSLLWDNVTSIVIDFGSELLNWYDSNLGWVMRDAMRSVPRIFLSLLLIVLGIRMIRGKKAELAQSQAEEAPFTALPETVSGAETEEAQHEQ